MPSARLDGPTPLQLLRDLPRLYRTPLDVFVEWRQRYGDVIRVPLTRPLTIQLGNPDDIKHILVSKSENYRKTGALVIGEQLLGRGLIASQEPLHAQQRRIIQPMFHRQRVISLADLVVTTASEQMAHWRIGEIVDLSREMARITLIIVARAFFGLDMTGVADEIGQSFGICLKFMQRWSHFVPESLSLSLHRRYRAAVTHVDSVIYAHIVARRAVRGRPDDLLSVLFEARGRDGRALDDKQIRDEIITVLLAGHETTANALVWTWYLLSRHPSIHRRMFTEIHDVCGARRPGLDALARLTYTEMVLLESMRLFPPVWILARMALGDDVLESGLRIPAGTIVIIFPYVSHRDARYFANPDTFDPERFAPGARKALPAFVYFPFGGGDRGCIGESFARMESVLLLATIAQQYELELVQNQRVVPDPRMTLRPRHGLEMRVKSRHAN